MKPLTTPQPCDDLAQAIDRSRAIGKIVMRDRQEPKCEHYQRVPGDAMITDMARTSSESIAATCPLYGQLSLCHNDLHAVPIGVHTAVGGESDAPTPGDLLCGAIASCLDSTLRIVSNRVGVRLKKLEVEVKGRVDVRGTLRVDKSVPVGFQRFEVNVLLKPRGFVPRILIDKLIRAAEHSCVVIQTVRGSAEVVINRR